MVDKFNQGKETYCASLWNHHGAKLGYIQKVGKEKERENTRVGGRARVIIFVAIIVKLRKANKWERGLMQDLSAPILSPPGLKHQILLILSSPVSATRPSHKHGRSPKQATKPLVLVRGQRVKHFPHSPSLWQDKLSWLELWSLGWKVRLPNSILKVSHHPSGFACRVHSRAEGVVLKVKLGHFNPSSQMHRGGQGFWEAILFFQVL